MSLFADLNLDPSTTPSPTKPAEIFRRLNLRGRVENLWEPQAEALRLWDASRGARDTVVEMNTGGGKTLVGLLAAKSLANESQRGVVYACPTRQLVEQVVSKAAEVGVETATYLGRTGWRNREVFDTASGPCVATYAAVFNGRSRFGGAGGDDVWALLLDDAHVAAGLLRNHFTVQLPLPESPVAAPPLAKAGQEVFELFRTSIGDGHDVLAVRDVAEGRSRSALYVPAFAVYERAVELRTILMDNGVTEGRTKFAWEHIKDRLGVCSVLVGQGNVEIAPPVLPLWDVPAFRDAERRVYLTATAPTAPEFVRTFGVARPEVVRPGGRSGEAQRLFVFPPGDTDEEQREAARVLVADRKALVMVPSAGTAKSWGVDPYDGEAAVAALPAFAASKAPGTLVLAARYDGIDLPGDACRVLVVDGVPRGEALFDQFQEDVLRAPSLRGPRTAVRIAQALGRIFRSNTDHGAVVVVGDELRTWLRTPKNARLLPAHVQKQLGFGNAIAPQLVGPGQLSEAIRLVIDGDPDFDRQYAQYVERAAPRVDPAPPEWLSEAYEKERAGYALLWNGDPSGAASEFMGAFGLAETADEGLAAWFLHLSGLALLGNGDREAAMGRFGRAAQMRGQLGRLAAPPVLGTGTTPTAQARAIEAVMAESTDATRETLDRVDRDLRYGEPYSTPAEVAMVDLGRLLGLTSSSPDDLDDTGPDTLWLAPEADRREGQDDGAAFELKTGMGEGSRYKKNKEVGQIHDHTQYLRTHHPDLGIPLRVVGRLLPVSRQANPPPGVTVVTLEEVRGLAARVRALYEGLGPERVEGGFGHVGVSFAHRVQGWLERYELDWPRCVTGLASTPIEDLKDT